MNKIELELSQKEIEFLKQYAKVYDEERKLDCTRDPIVVVEDVEEIVTDDEYGYDETRYRYGDCFYNTIENLREALIEEEKENIEEIIEEVEEYGETLEGNIQKIPVIIRHNPVAYFLTRAEADKYCEYQGHNLRRPRVYSRSTGYSNNGDLDCLLKLLLNTGRQLLNE